MRLGEVLDEMGAIAVAVSGGVDSLTLMAFAHEHGFDAVAYHAVSPAVPPSSTARVHELADRLRFRVRVIDAGEASDPKYLANPADRCFVCKSHLYDAIRASTTRAIVSGTNVDDLGDHRPGLDAARERGVRHPFVEAGLTKHDVRALARELGLDDVAELPAQPCLSSRIETGIAIHPETLATVNAVEDAVRDRIGAKFTVRCRVRKSGVVVELEERALADLSDAGKAALVDVARTLSGVDAVELQPYRMGSAFLRVMQS
jgi:uncharacterized protein